MANLTELSRKEDSVILLELLEPFRVKFTLKNEAVGLRKTLRN